LASTKTLKTNDAIFLENYTKLTENQLFNLWSRRLYGTINEPPAFTGVPEICFIRSPGL